mgnify:CR=1 FL=1
MKYIMPPMAEFEDEFWNQLSHEFTDKRIYDRTHSIDLPYDQVDISPIPEYKQINDSFSDVSQSVAEDIWNNSDDPLYVLWSGGIDSTNIVTSLLKIGAFFTIVYSDTSIEENPYFYKNIVRKAPRFKFKDFYLMLSELSEKPVTLISGEFGDYCTREVGIANKKGWVEGTGFIWDVDDGIPDSRKEFLQPVLDACPFDLESNADEFWWLFWTMKWQLNATRYHCIARKRINNLIHFYEHPLIQLWSMNNPVATCHDSIHKFQIKESIREYYRTDDVFEWTKQESTPKNLFGHKGKRLFDVHKHLAKTGRPNHGSPYGAWIDEDWNMGGFGRWHNE